MLVMEEKQSERKKKLQVNDLVSMQILSKQNQVKQGKLGGKSNNITCPIKHRNPYPHVTSIIAIQKKTSWKAK